MKKKYFSCLCLFCTFSALAQTTELNITVGSGLYFYSGSSAASKQHVNLYAFSPLYIGGFPGKKPGFSQTVGFQIKHIAKSGFENGVEFQLQRLISRWIIDSLVYWPEFGWPTSKSVNGSSNNQEYFIAWNTYVGKRFLRKKFRFDVTGGVEFALRMRNIHHVTAIDNSGQKVIDLSDEVDNRKFDIRPNFLFTSTYRRYFLTLGYAHGLLNYFYKTNGAQSEAYSRFIKFTLGYRLK